MTLPRTASSVQWRKSSRSQEEGACVELAALRPSIAVRDSKNPDGEVLNFGRTAWRSFSERVKGA